MTVVVLIVIAVLAMIVVIASRKAARRNAAEADLAAHPPHPAIAAVLREEDAGHWTIRRSCHQAVRLRTDDILGVLERHRESLVLITHSTSVAFDGLLVLTQGRTIHYGGSSTTEVPHAGTDTKILVSGSDGRHAIVEIVGGGRTIRYAADGLTEARLICAVVDLWASSPEVRPNPHVRIGPAGIEIDDAFFADTLRQAGHAVTPFNMRSIHERFGMQFHTKAQQYLASSQGEAARQQFMAVTGRPDDDRELPGWPVKVMREWCAADRDIAPVAVFFPLWVQNVLLATAHDGGYLSQPGQTLSMWKNTWYDDGGRGARRSIPA